MKLSLVSLMVIGLFSCSVNAEVVVDDSFSLGNAGSIDLINNQYSITEGRGELRGSNLFYSFSEFNIEAEKTAVFSGLNGIENIISRITGGNASLIDGAIVSEISGANLWLLNPDGIVFGRGSRVDVQGSFFASTADNIQLRDGTVFYADVNNTDILIASPPETFGFLSNPLNAKIIMDNVKITVPKNESITVLGSDLTLNGAFLSAPGGKISVVSINEIGDIIYSDQGLDLNNTESFGPLSINSTSFKIDGEQKGLLQIKGGDLDFKSSETDFVSSVTNLNVGFSEEQSLMEQPCELADFYNQGNIHFTVNESSETEYGVKTKKIHRGPIGVADPIECL